MIACNQSKWGNISRYDGTKATKSIITYITKLMDKRESSKRYMITNFYMTDAVSRASATMAKCTKVFGPRV